MIRMEKIIGTIMVLTLVLIFVKCQYRKSNCNELDPACNFFIAYFLFTLEDPCRSERSSMLICYEFNGNSLDSGPLFNHGTLFGNVDFLTNENNASNAYHIAKGDVASYILIPDSVFNGLGDFTASYWGKLDNVGSHLHYYLNVSNTIATTGEAFGMSYESGITDFQVNLDTTLGASVYNTTLPLDLQWHYFVYLREGSQIRLYIDGQLVKTTSGVSTSLLTSGPNGALIGQEADTCCAAGTFDGNQNMAGMIDNLIIYNIALNDATIIELFQNTY